MFLNGQNYWLTNHGRKRYLERVGEAASDAEMIRTAVQGLPGYRFVWRPPNKQTRGQGLRLVTVMEVPMFRVGVMCCKCDYGRVINIQVDKFITLRCSGCGNRTPVRVPSEEVVKDGTYVNSSVVITTPQDLLERLRNARLAVLREEQTEAHGLVVAETAVSTWNYHLRLTLPENVRYGGGVGLKALCGKKVGWDTQLPLGTYGMRMKHIPEKFCGFCKLLGEDLGYTVGR